MIVLSQDVTNQRRILKMLIVLILYVDDNMCAHNVLRMLEVWAAPERVTDIDFYPHIRATSQASNFTCFLFWLASKTKSLILLLSQMNARQAYLILKVFLHISPWVLVNSVFTKHLYSLKWHIKNCFSKVLRLGQRLWLRNQGFQRWVIPSYLSHIS